MRVSSWTSKANIVENGALKRVSNHFPVSMVSFFVLLEFRILGLVGAFLTKKALRYKYFRIF